MREAQRKRAEIANLGTIRSSCDAGESSSEDAPPVQRFAAHAPDFTATQASMQAAGQKAGAYISSWGVWASERRKGWAKGSLNASSENVSAGVTSPTKQGKWNSGIGGKKIREEKGGDGIGRLDA